MTGPSKLTGDPRTAWEEKRSGGITSYLFFEGVIKIGGPFAVAMQVIGFFLLREQGQTLADYFGSSRTWVTFFAHATLFGLVMGYLNWRRNEAAFRGRNGS